MSKCVRGARRFFQSRPGSSGICCETIRYSLGLTCSSARFCVFSKGKRGSGSRQAKQVEYSLQLLGRAGQGQSCQPDESDGGSWDVTAQLAGAEWQQGRRVRARCLQSVHGKGPADSLSAPDSGDRDLCHRT